MRNAIHQLKEEVHHNNFKTYQLGFLKQKRLNQKQLIQIKMLVTKMEKTKDFNQFKSYCNRVSQKIGWGSQYTGKNLHLFGTKK
ncbi:hypothetical protein [Staphylococcus saccharolyticus]|nr:hypothetical protein [Staphylococcus saccharolyticus]